jgi:hypothetical protein
MMRKDGSEIEGWNVLSQNEPGAEVAAELLLARRQFEMDATRLQLPLSLFTITPNRT